MKLIIKVLLCLCCFFSFAKIMVAQETSPLYGVDGKSIYGYYDIDNKGYFIGGKVGLLTVVFLNERHKISVDRTKYSDIICDGYRLSWTPSKTQVAKIISIDIMLGDSCVEKGVQLRLPIRPNSSPKYKFEHGENIKVAKTTGQSLDYDLSQFIIDEDEGDKLTYSYLGSELGIRVSSTGTLTITRDFPNNTTIDVGVEDEHKSTFTVKVTISRSIPSPSKPKFSPAPEPLSRSISYHKGQPVSEGEPINPILISAIDESNGNSEVPVKMNDNSLGLEFVNGQLQGFISFTAVQEDLPRDQIGTPQKRTVILQSTNSEGTSELFIDFYVKAKASDEEKDEYKDKRNAVLGYLVDVFKLAGEKYSIMYDDVNKVAKNREAITTIDKSIDVVSGVAAIAFPASTVVAIPAVALLKGLNGVIASQQNGTAKRIGDQITTLQSKMTEILTPMVSFFRLYKEKPESEYSFGRDAMNEMEDSRLIIEIAYLSYKNEVEKIKRITQLPK